MVLLSGITFVYRCTEKYLITVQNCTEKNAMSQLFIVTQ